jgi:uncharacterized membrane protein
MKLKTLNGQRFKIPIIGALAETRPAIDRQPGNVTFRTA